MHIYSARNKCSEGTCFIGTHPFPGKRGSRSLQVVFNLAREAGGPALRPCFQKCSHITQTHSFKLKHSPLPWRHHRAVCYLYLCLNMHFSYVSIIMCNSGELIGQKLYLWFLCIYIILYLGYFSSICCLLAKASQILVSAFHIMLVR